MKKTPRKLELNRETLVRLESPLGKVAGGAEDITRAGSGCVGCLSYDKPCG
jgi:hypothetical protein